MGRSELMNLVTILRAKVGELEEAKDTCARAVLAAEEERRKREEAEGKFSALRSAVIAYAERYSLRHRIECPEDDTCDCPLTQGIVRALAGLATPDPLHGVRMVVAEMRKVVAEIRTASLHFEPANPGAMHAWADRLERALRGETRP